MKNPLLFVLFPFFLSGCLILHDGKLPRHDPMLIADYTKEKPKSAFLDFSITIEHDSNVTKLSPKNSQEQLNRLNEILQESKTLQITTDANRAEVQISVSLLEKQFHNLGWYLLTAATATLIPYHGSNEYRLEATVKSGSFERKYVIEDGSESYVQLFLFPAPLFHWPRSVYNVIENMYRDLALQIRSDFSAL